MASGDGSTRKHLSEAVQVFRVRIRGKVALFGAEVVGCSQAVRAEDGRSEVPVLCENGTEIRNRTFGQVGHLPADSLEWKPHLRNELSGLPSVCEHEYGGAREDLCAGAQGGPESVVVTEALDVLVVTRVDPRVFLEPCGAEGGGIHPATLFKKPATARERMGQPYLGLLLFKEPDVALRVGMLEC
jgi:hypothetical protein